MVFAWCSVFGFFQHLDRIYWLHIQETEFGSDSINLNKLVTLKIEAVRSSQTSEQNINDK
jgi:hypothetical protein